MFKVKDRDITSVEPLDYLAVTEGEEYALGEALKFGETATKCGISEKPTHICMGKKYMGNVPAMPVLATTRFEVPYTEKPNVGDAVQLSEDATQVMATTGGAFTVTGVNEETKTAFGYFR